MADAKKQIDSVGHWLAWNGPYYRSTAILNQVQHHNARSRGLLCPPADRPSSTTPDPSTPMTEFIPMEIETREMEVAVVGEGGRSYHLKEKPATRTGLLP